ncbi:ABC transporter ATP-binding protein/permease [Alphaproteobacteria bacterium]|nr:ABC transporter ATP-binding protein/permease [Alphaproteobacteria bacterium]
MSESKAHFLRISNLFFEYKIKMVIAVFCMIVAALCTGFHAWLVKPALDQVLVNANKFYLYFIPGAILVTGVIKGLATYTQVTSLQFMSHRIIEKLRRDVFHNLINLHYGFFTQNRTGSLITRITTDTYYLSGAMANTYTALIKDSLTLLVLIGNMFYQNWKLALISMAVFPLALIPVRVLGKKIRIITKNLQHQIGNLASNLEEIFKGIKNVKSFNAEGFEILRINKEIAAARELNFKQEKVTARSRPFTETLGSLAAGLAIFGGGIFVINDNMTAGELMSFLVSLMLAYAPLKNLINVNVLLQSGLGAASRIFEFIDMKNDIFDGSKTIKDFDEIKFKNVFFKYPNTEKNVLNGININLRKNKKIAIVGPSGSGKSTLLGLMIRLFDLDKGEIIIGNENIKDLRLKNLRSYFSLVSQDTVLFDGSISENIKYNSQLSTKSIEKFAELACVDEIIEKLPQGLNSQIGENGVKLSGGQRQRIAIARALAQQKSIILLDEPTSNLDLRTESKLFDNLHSIRNITLVVVAHRLSTIKHFDEILYLESGKLLEQGSHKSLMAKKGFYYQLYQKQLKKNA